MHQNVVVAQHFDVLLSMDSLLLLRHENTGAYVRKDAWVQGERGEQSRLPLAPLQA